MKWVAMLVVGVLAVAATGCGKSCFLCKSGPKDEPPAGTVERFDEGTPVGTPMPQGGVVPSSYETQADASTTSRSTTVSPASRVRLGTMDAGPGEFR